MDRGALAVARILIVALALGIAVILWHPAYRATWRSLVRGNPASSPIWISNESYYPSVHFYPDTEHGLAK